MAGPRRNLLVGALVLGGGYSLLRFGPPAIAGLFADEFEFEPLAEPAGFRRMAGGDSSSGFNPFFGLDGFPEQQATALDEEVRFNVCDVLYDGAMIADGVVPIASFSDYNCPFCRVLTLRLAEIEEASQGAVRISWHELPLLGEASTMAARGALAAKRQGSYVAFHRRLMQAPFQTTPEYLEILADKIGVDHGQLLDDMTGEEVDRELAQSGALARLFGFIGTPALVVGRTIVQGQIGDAALNRLIDLERAEGPMTACA